jgi:AcrR family transcriptional regulator
MARTVGSTATDTRRRVLETALALFTERGYGGTSLRDIAAQLDITKAALYYHFPAKDNLLRALTEPLVSKLAACARDAGRIGPRDLLRRIVDVLDDHRRLLRGILHDPAARQVLVGEHGIFAELTTLEEALAPSGSPTDLLRARCATGAIRGALLPAGDVDSLVLDRPPTTVPGPLLSAADRENVTAAAYAALTSSWPSI